MKTGCNSIDPIPHITWSVNPICATANGSFAKYISVCKFHITSHFLCWASGHEATKCLFRVPSWAFHTAASVVTVCKPYPIIRLQRHRITACSKALCVETNIEYLLGEPYSLFTLKKSSLSIENQWGASFS